MVVCSNCGAHYSEEFLQCPQCGSTKRMTEAEAKNNNSPIGFLVTLLIVGVLAGIAGYGIYLLFNPLKPESVIEDYPTSETTSEISSTSTNTTTTDTTTTTTRITTTKLIGEENNPVGSGHTYTKPDGFTIVEVPQEMTSMFPESQGMACILREPNERYCFSMLDNYNISVSSANKAKMDENLKSMGYSELISARMYGTTYYYFYRIDGEYISGGLYRNKGTNMILSSFNLIGNNVDENSMQLLISILNSIK